MHTHSDRLERWLGAEHVAHISHAMKGFYWPVAVAGVPGNIMAMPGGDFTGRILAGSEVSAMERATVEHARIMRNRTDRMAMSSRQLGAFADLSALIAARTGGKGRDVFYQKTGAASNAIGNCNDLWTRAGQPSAGAAGGAAGTGAALTSATTGSIKWVNPTNADTTHFISAWPNASVINNSLLLYDRLWSVVKTMNSSATEAVNTTNLPTRYQSTTTTNADYIGGNFCFPSNPTTVLAATAHNWTVCQYTDDAGGTGNSFPSIAGVSACVVGGVDLVAGGGWFMPLAAGDVGVKNVTQLQCSAAVATGTIDFVLGHPIAFMGHPAANLICVVDGINTAFNFAKIFDSACLAFLEVNKPATTATNYNGQILLCGE